MSDYTPDTARVRDVYGLFARDTASVRGDQDAFDRWLAAHDAEVRADEREKCIVIAESRAEDLRYCHKNDDCDTLARGIGLAVDDIRHAAARGESTSQQTTTEEKE